MFRDSTMLTAEFTAGMTGSHIAGLVLVAGVLLGIRRMESPRTALWGNRLSAVCMAGFILLTLFGEQLLSQPATWSALGIGAGLGLWLGIRAQMIRMPEIVALFNGLGGAASALVAWMALVTASGTQNVYATGSARLGLATGAVTLSGSLVAGAKLSRLLTQRPLCFKGQATMNTVLILVAGVCAIYPGEWPADALLASNFFAFLSLTIGAMIALRVGGADMPVTISLLNALSGIAAAFAGFAVGHPVLVAVGGIVGASGLMLTRIMCKAMNRSLFDIFTARTTSVAPREVAGDETAGHEPSAGAVPSEKSAEHVIERGGRLLREAKSVVLIPGYGMAVAQAQHEVKDLFDKLERAGKDVCFAIHPVAGRMPGHMHVLLAEAQVPYERFREMESVNPEFPSVDVAVVVGANDVVNPAANTAVGTPIYGMPVLDAVSARHIIVCNINDAPGYAGVKNPLYERSEAVLLWGDAKQTVRALAESFEHGREGV